MEGGRRSFKLIPNSTFFRRGRRDLSSLGARELEGEGYDGISLSDADLADEVVLLSDSTTSPPTSPEPLPQPLGVTLLNKA